MAFQEFGGLSERRKAERQQKIKKRVTIGIVSFLAVAALAACAVVAVNYRSNSDAPAHNTKTIKPNEIPQTAKAIKMVCSATDYKETCQTSLSKAVGSDADVQPKQLLKAAISVISDEVSKAIDRTSMLKQDDPLIRGAVEDCHKLLEYAKDELNTTLSDVHENEMKDIQGRSHDLKSWLSAVMSYQQTCVDGFPEGEVKSKMKAGLKKVKEMTSNALAITSEVTSLLEMFPSSGLGRRRLLEDATAGRRDLPLWMTREDRRLLDEASLPSLKPDVVVAQDGSGAFKTINEALANIPKKRQGRFVIHIKAGIYDETVIVDKNMVNITMIGDGSRQTVITGGKNFVDGIRTFQTATFAAIGDGFIAKQLSFRNTAGAIKHQAVALRVQSDRSIFLNCRMEGYQDTLYAQTHRQFYRSCVICGTVDFIFGDAAAVFQNCMIVVRKPLDNQQNIVTAHGRIDRHETTGFVIQNCRFIPDKKLVPLKDKIPSYLGRPWKEYSRTVVMESTIDDLIHPNGWLEWEGDFALKTLFYAEYNNSGPGSSLASRVKWPGYKIIKKEDANSYTVANFIQGDQWIKDTDAPVHLSLFA